jgi:hypothetical protein
VVDPARVAVLQEAAVLGATRSDAIAYEYCGGDPARAAIARVYLRNHLRYTLDDRALAGLQTYYREAEALGIIDRVPAPQFFEAPAEETAHEPG